MAVKPFDAAVIRAATPTTTGTQSFTVPGFGAAKAAIVKVFRTTADGTEHAGLAYSWGATDGSVDRAAFGISQDGVGPSNCAHGGSTAHCVHFLSDAGTLLVQASFSAFVTDGIELNFSTVDASNAWTIEVILFGGDECMVAVQSVRTAAGTDTIDVEVSDPTFDASFEPDAVFTAHMGTNTGALAPDLDIFFGIAANDGSAQNSCAGMTCGDNLATTDTRRRFGPDVISETYSWSTGSPVVVNSSWISAYSSTGFTVTSANNISNGPRFAFLAIKFSADGSVPFAMDKEIPTPVVGSPGPFGTEAATWPGHRSDLLYAVASSNTSSAGPQAGGSCGVGIAANVESSVSLRDNRNVSTSDSATRTSENLLDLFNNDGTSHLYRAHVDSVDPDGYTLDFTAAWTNARGYAVLSVQIDLTTVEVQASTATTSLAGQVVHGASISAQASTATTTVDADTIEDADVSAQASTATATAAGDVLGVASISAQADDATASLTGQVVHEAAIGAQASAATTNLDAQVAHLAEVAAQADTAAVDLDAQVAHLASIAAQADTATAAVDADTIEDADIAAQAGAASTSLTATVVHAASVTADADAASTALEAQRVSQTALALQAETATVDLDVSTSLTADIAAIAETAEATVSGTRVHEADVNAQAATATAALAAQLAHLADVDAQSAVASTALDADTIEDAEVAASADDASASATSQVVHQTSLAVAASNATVSSTGTVETAGVVTAAVAAQASTATTNLAVELVPVAEINASADTATTTLATQVVHEAAIGAQADTAVAGLTGSRVRDASLQVTAEPASASSTADLIHQTALALSAAPASASLTVERILTAAINAQAPAATSSLTSQLIHVTDAAVQAETATTVLLLLNALADVNVTLALQADAATALLLGQVVHQANLDAAAAGARARALEVFPILQPGGIPTVMAPQLSAVATARLSADLMAPRLEAVLIAPPDAEAVFSP